jgi:hypothetical protein
LRQVGAGLGVRLLEDGRGVLLHRWMLWNAPSCLLGVCSLTHG